MVPNCLLNIPIYTFNEMTIADREASLSSERECRESWLAKDLTISDNEMLIPKHNLYHSPPKLRNTVEEGAGRKEQWQWVLCSGMTVTAAMVTELWLLALGLAAINHRLRRCSLGPGAPCWTTDYWQTQGQSLSSAVDSLRSPLDSNQKPWVPRRP